MTSLVSLKRSIKSLGLFTPILVRKSDSGKYVIISGHRRFRAFKEIVADYKVIRTELENRGEDTGEVEKEIEKYSSIPAIVFTVVDDNSELLGTDPK